MAVARGIERESFISQGGEHINPGSERHHQDGELTHWGPFARQMAQIFLHQPSLKTRQLGDLSGLDCSRWLSSGKEKSLLAQSVVYI